MSRDLNGKAMLDAPPEPLELLLELLPVAKTSLLLPPPPQAATDMRAMAAPRLTAIRDVFTGLLLVVL